MLNSDTAVGATCTSPSIAEIKLCPNPQCQQPFSGAELTCSFHCASAYVGFTALRDEFNSAVDDAVDMFLTISEPRDHAAKVAHASTQPTHRVTLRLIPPPPATPEEATFTPAAWAAANLDLLRPPATEDYQKLGELAIPQLKSLYQMLLRDYAHNDWPDLVWDTLSSLLERELAALLLRAGRSAVCGHRQRRSGAEPISVASGGQTRRGEKLMDRRVDGYFIKCAASLAGVLTEEISVPSEMLAGPEQDAGYAAVSAHEEEVVIGLASWLAELPPPDFRPAPPPVGADPLTSLNLGELLPDYGLSCVYLVAEAVLRLYRPYLLAALAVSRKGGSDD